LLHVSSDAQYKELSATLQAPPSVVTHVVPTQMFGAAAVAIATKHATSNKILLIMFTAAILPTVQL
jgi:ADP-ribosylglycohydrolase